MVFSVRRRKSAAFHPTQVVFGETANPATDRAGFDEKLRRQPHGVPWTASPPRSTAALWWGADCSTTRYMDRGAVLGGAVVDSGKFDWSGHADKFPGAARMTAITASPTPNVTKKLRSLL